jgi:hypothetical protein
MQDWPRPKTIKRLCDFLGLTSYYRKFVQNYGKIVAPLTALLKNNSFTWTLVVDLAFQALKVAMCNTLVLALHDFTKTFVLECDASMRGIGAVLMQEGRCLAFTNKQLSERHLVQSIYEKEMLAIFMQWISGALISWGNASKLRQIIKASNILWSNDLPLQRNKNG